MFVIIKNRITDKTESILVSFYKSMVCLHVEYCSQLWSPHLRKELEKGQRRAAGMMRSMGGASIGDTEEVGPVQFRKERTEGLHEEGFQSTKC